MNRKDKLALSSYYTSSNDLKRILQKNSDNPIEYKYVRYSLEKIIKENLLSKKQFLEISDQFLAKDWRCYSILITLYHNDILSKKELLEFLPRANVRDQRTTFGCDMFSFLVLELKLKPDQIIQALNLPNIENFIVKCSRSLDTSFLQEYNNFIFKNTSYVNLLNEVNRSNLYFSNLAYRLEKHFKFNLDTFIKIDKFKRPYYLFNCVGIERFFIKDVKLSFEKLLTVYTKKDLLNYFSAREYKDFECMSCEELDQFLKLTKSRKLMDNLILKKVFTEEEQWFVDKYNLSKYEIKYLKKKGVTTNATNKLLNKVEETNQFIKLSTL